MLEVCNDALNTYPPTIWLNVFYDVLHLQVLIVTAVMEFHPVKLTPQHIATNRAPYPRAVVSWGF